MTTSPSRPPSLATTRNAQLRTALGGLFPAVKFLVRNGPNGQAAVSWVDGPTTDRVRATLLGQAATLATWWRASQLSRRATPELVAAAFVRERAAGHTSAYYERDRNGRYVAAGQLVDVAGAGWSHCWNQLDDDDVSDQDRARARMVIVLAGPLPTSEPGLGRVLGRTVFHYGHVVEAACG